MFFLLRPSPVEDIFRQEQESVQKERQELLGQMEEHKRLENERIARIRMENLQYQSDLEQQINYQRQQKEKQIEEARRELKLTHVSLYFLQFLL